MGASRVRQRRPEVARPGEQQVVRTQAKRAYGTLPLQARQVAPRRGLRCIVNDDRLEGNPARALQRGEQQPAIRQSVMGDDDDAERWFHGGRHTRDLSPGETPAAGAKDVEVVLLGTGLFAEELTDLLEVIPGMRLVAYCENHDRTRVGSTLLGLPVVWFEELPSLGDVRAACAITTTRREGYIASVRAMGIGFCQLIHPSAIVAPSVRIGEGVVIGAGAVIGARTTIGDHVVINRGALIGHHVEVDELATIQPGAIVGGAGRVGARAYIALGARVLDRLTVGEGALVAAGAVVTRSVEPHVQVAGVPARVVREGITGR